MSQVSERIVTTACASHCGGACVLKVHVSGGKITRIETDSGEEPQLRACLRCRAYRQRVYAPDRLTFPLKRTGNRGEGKFKRISWNKALDTIAKELMRARDSHGPASILCIPSPGDINQIHCGAKQIHMLLCRLGGYTKVWGGASYQGDVYASYATYGTWRTSNARDDLTNSRLIIMWGWNPASTISGTNTCWYLARARESGIRMIAIDPQYTDTAATFAEKWIPIIPGTDTAMLIAMAYVIIKEDIQDQRFLDTYTVGFDKFRDYVLGIEDKIPKTPSWAEAITGVPASVIHELAREYASTKPAALLAGIAPGRTAYGEQFHRVAMSLAAMTGNVGVHGGYGGKAWGAHSWYPYKIRFGFSFQHIPNPVYQSPTVIDGSAMFYHPSGIHLNDVANFILQGKDGGYPVDPKFLYVVNCNYLTQFPNSNKTARALQKLDFIVVHEQFMTPIAKFADIILPITTVLERNDIYPGVGIPYYVFGHKAIEPVGETKSPVDIARELARRLGISDFDNSTEEELIRKEIAGTEIPDYQTYKGKALYKIELKEPYVAFKQQIDDPANNPFPTPSGKIEIYSQVWADLNNPLVPPVPKYIETWESRNDLLAKKYPLQLITTHFKRRALSQFDNVPWLRELESQAVIISSHDAKVRGITDGDMVIVYNDRGQVSIPAKVTERIIPGVVDLPHGAWNEPDDKGVDRGGCANVLTNDKYSPGGAFPFNTCLVQIEKILGDDK